MSHYEIPLIISVLLFLALYGYGAYRKGCRDKWRAADEIAQIEPFVPPQTEPRTIVFPGNNPLTWNKLVATCPECPPSYLDESEMGQDEQEQAL